MKLHASFFDAYEDEKWIEVCDRVVALANRGLVAWPVVDRVLGDNRCVRAWRPEHENPLRYALRLAFAIADGTPLPGDEEVR